MIKNKKILVVGAGNAGRPVANLLNFLENSVVVNDLNSYENLPKKAKQNIDILKNRGIVFELGSHDNIVLNDFDYVFISPNIPEKSPFIIKINDFATNGKINIIETKQIGKILNSLISIPMIGIAGTDGKTTSTNMINYQFSQNKKTLIFSSLQNSLVIEGLVEMIINNDGRNKDLAIFELPHGTIRLAEGLELTAALLINLTPDHMDEFN
ncbi:MAG: hypothetical protein LBM96_12245, partial [Methanobrevibacter sp.]|nr:hypothetical protein [Candidatus Methanoflexus mossambicus]